MEIHGTFLGRSFRKLILDQIVVTDDQRRQIMAEEYWADDKICHLSLQATNQELYDDAIVPGPSGFFIPESSTEISVLGVVIGTVTIPSTNHKFSGLTVSGKPEDVFFLR